MNFIWDQFISQNTTKILKVKKNKSTYNGQKPISQYNQHIDSYTGKTKEQDCIVFSH